MKSFTLLAALLPLAAQAYPGIQANVETDDAHVEAHREVMKRANKDPLGISKAETNCGPIPCTTFDQNEQFVSTTGEHVYQSPATDDIRGPCPGLNAAANHGYLPRSGIATIEETVGGLFANYGLSKGANAFLATYAIVLDGNLVQGVWSIGGPLPTDLLTGSTLGTGQGLSYSHNSYEGDSSIGRNDAYLDDGNAHSLNVTKFELVHSYHNSKGEYTLDLFRQRLQHVQDYSIAHNGYYFTGLFSTVVVVPAAYNFVINLMSNHSAEQPSGYLNSYNFKKFFAIEGQPGSFKWIRGQERIPENWYRRPSDNPYSLNAIGGDVGIGYAAYPNTLKFGGNTGKPNTYTGVSVEKLTGGSFNAQTLLQGDNFACFAFLIAQEGIPDFLKGPLAKVNAGKAAVSKTLAPFFSKLKCPQLDHFDQSLFNSYPGRHYNPTGKATNY